MNNKLTNIARKYADSLNNKIAQELNDFIMKNASLASQRSFAKDYQEHFTKVFKTVTQAESEILDGKNLKDFLDELNETELLEFTLAFAEVFEYDLPEIVLTELKTISQAKQEDLVDKLFNLPITKDKNQATKNERGDLYLLRALLRILALWENKARLERVLDWYMQHEFVEEFTSDEVLNFLVKEDELAFKEIEPLVASYLDNYSAKNSQMRKEKALNLLDVLVKIAVKHEKLQDDTYKLLTIAFEELPDKSLISFQFADLDYPRAIPFLRTYIMLNEDTISEELYYDIIYSLKRLGAKTDDLPDLGERFNK